jgi:hypothetical protein
MSVRHTARIAIPPICSGHIDCRVLDLSAQGSRVGVEVTVYATAFIVEHSRIGMSRSAGRVPSSTRRAFPITATPSCRTSAPRLRQSYAGTRSFDPYDADMPYVVEIQFTMVERQPRESRLAPQRFGCFRCQRSQRVLPANLGIATDIAVVAQKHQKTHWQSVAVGLPCPWVNSCSRVV